MKTFVVTQVVRVSGKNVGLLRKWTERQLFGACVHYVGEEELHFDRAGIALTEVVEQAEFHERRHNPFVGVKPPPF